MSTCIKEKKKKKIKYWNLEKIEDYENIFKLNKI